METALLIDKHCMLINEVKTIVTLCETNVTICLLPRNSLFSKNPRKLQISAFRIHYWKLRCMWKIRRWIATFPFGQTLSARSKMRRAGDMGWSLENHINKYILTWVHWVLGHQVSFNTKHSCCQIIPQEGTFTFFTLWCLQSTLERIYVSL